MLQPRPLPDATVRAYAMDSATALALRTPRDLQVEYLRRRCPASLTLLLHSSPYACCGPF